MQPESYTLSEFVTDLRNLTRDTDDEQTLLNRLKPLARRAASDRRWLTQNHYRADQEQGFGSSVLHVEPDNSLFIVAFSWLPGRSAPAHDHGTWSIIVGVDGPEQNIFWERLDDGTRAGYARLRKTAERTIREGDVIGMPAGAIHSVSNETSQTTLSFHVYGRHLNHTGRSQFDTFNDTCEPFTIRTQ